MNVLIEESALANSMGDLQTVWRREGGGGEGWQVLGQGGRRLQGVRTGRRGVMTVCAGTGQGQGGSEEGENAVQAEGTGTAHRANQFRSHLLCKCKPNL